MSTEGEKEPESVFDAENYTLEIQHGKVKRKVELFEKVKVKISDEAEQSTGKRKIRMQLV
jgi:exosome complex exonuclease DIS3/RRP44